MNTVCANLTGPTPADRANEILELIVHAGAQVEVKRTLAKPRLAYRDSARPAGWEDRIVQIRPSRPLEAVAVALGALAYVVCGLLVTWELGEWLALAQVAPALAALYWALTTLVNERMITRTETGIFVDTGWLPVPGRRHFPVSEAVRITTGQHFPLFSRNLDGTTRYYVAILHVSGEEVMMATELDSQRNAVRLQGILSRVLLGEAPPSGQTLRRYT